MSIMTDEMERGANGVAVTAAASALSTEPVIVVTFPRAWLRGSCGSRELWTLQTVAERRWPHRILLPGDVDKPQFRVHASGCYITPIEFIALNLGEDDRATTMIAIYPHRWAGKPQLESLERQLKAQHENFIIVPGDVREPVFHIQTNGVDITQRQTEARRDTLGFALSIFAVVLSLVALIVSLVSLVAR